MVKAPNSQGFDGCIHTGGHGEMLAALDPLSFDA
jgi:hypothetical protein